MTTVALETVGCRLNQYETEKMASKLIAQGMVRVAYDHPADLYILNSCTVTGHADADCRKLVNRAFRANKDAVIVVTGCYAVSEREAVAALQGVDLVVGNEEKERLPEILRVKFPRLFDGIAGDKTGAADNVASPVLETGFPSSTDELSLDVFSRNRRPVKIGDGCNQDCSYCIVPSVRGRLTCLEAEAIIDDVRRLVDDGYHEVVLTAVHIGQYDDRGLKLAALTEKILAETDLSRLRLSSLEPNELDDRLMALAAHNPRVCRHLHLPLQSGSNRILDLMHRPYHRQDYLAVVRRVKQANPDITIGCDLIVGFPGEGEEDFNESLAVLTSGDVDYGHIFSYSDRPGTPAAEFSGKLSPAIIKERSRLARDACHTARRRHMRSQLGQILEVISEGRPPAGTVYRGISDNYLRVKARAGLSGGREIVRLKATALGNDFLEGEIIE